jgi:hypothetical protein
MKKDLKKKRKVSIPIFKGKDREVNFVFLVEINFDIGKVLP